MPRGTANTNLVEHKAAVPDEGPGTLPSAQARNGRTVLIAIPDKETVLIANPKTRMPEQFKVGTTLPNGELLQSIDPKRGTVTTDKRSIALE